MTRAAQIIPLALSALLSFAPSGVTATLKVPADFGTIQAAIDAAAVDDVIQISGGTYFEHLSITSKFNLTIKPKSGDKVYIDGGGGAGDLLAVTVSDQILIQKLRFRDTTDDAITVLLSQSVTIDQCHIQDVIGNGITLTLNFPSVVKGCKIKDVGGNGIDATSAGAVIKNNTITDPQGIGISIHGETSTIEGNSITGAAIGIALGTGDVEAYQCLVSDNTIKKTSGGGGTGILLEDDARACYVVSNKISGATISNGIVVDDDSNDHVIAGNKCVGGDGTGIDVGGVGIILQGNNVKKSDLGIWIQSNCTDALIIDNKVKASHDAGLTIDGDATNFVRNTAKGSGTFDLVNNTGPGQNAFVDNVFGTIAP